MMRYAHRDGRSSGRNGQIGAGALRDQVDDQHRLRVDVGRFQSAPVLPAPIGVQQPRSFVLDVGELRVDVAGETIVPAQLLRLPADVPRSFQAREALAEFAIENRHARAGMIG